MLNVSKKVFQGEIKLKSFNWQCHTANRMTRALQILKDYDVKVAIAILTLDDIENCLKAVNQLNNQVSHLIWIAILVDTDVTKGNLSNNLTHYFSDYHHVPIKWERLHHTLGHAYGMAKLGSLHSTSGAPNFTAEKILGDSSAIKQLKRKIAKIAQVDETVLISGETGTGKGLCAHLIHRQSQRQAGPFVTVNCGALPAGLIHSELFGHEKGAFTGADKQYIGHIERAHKGTLFLDEIGDLSLELQVNLLQFLEDHIIERVGGSKNITIDCRIIFASHINLEAAVEEGRFREDLYYRINLLHLYAPSLREHKEDIPLLAKEYLKKYSLKDQLSTLTPNALKLMNEYQWPGNIREFKNRIHRAIIMANNRRLTEKDLGINILKVPPETNGVINLAQHRVEIDTELLLDAIKRNNHNISAAARELKISRTTFYRLIKKCKIKL
ncbi:sigma-54 dependent transcriptional regulator [Shewanella kaireitica]|nr:sigma-54 dependent transcriptional regulator [Shewanella kaireitica]